MPARCWFGSANGSCHAGAEFVLQAGAHRFLATIKGHATDIEAGTEVTAGCTLGLVGGYEWDAFGLPDLRGDWLVAGIERLPGPESGEPDYLLDLHAVTP